jgi:competence ComEA-like helix-hairpin-helix protein
MTQTQDLLASANGAPRLGQTHGYRIDGDLAHLNVELAFGVEQASAAQRWALQLWACDAPYRGGALTGTKIAEAPLELPITSEAQPQHLYAEAFARLPAGDREYSMVLVLASGDVGHFDRVHDFANYPAREPFVVPALRGAVTAEVDAEHVTVCVERVVNPRGLENLSGTLALELWALADDYHGGQFSGEALGGVELGRLAGGECFPTLALSAPVGSGHHVLMLREWTADGYVTRDFRELSVPVTAPTVADTDAAVSFTQPAAEGVNDAPQPTQDVSHDDESSLVSLGSASLDELAAVKGLNRKLAQAIIKARPYRTFEELLRVRGIGEKTIRKLRAVLTL